ncbi:MAG: GTP-binding protein TypA/BipA [Candidatus Ozemobacter sibiricus]|uniref:Large ribosomal subunit assembly factor BipA n=1 Tax=Candidatus Ozemobacter sibiricus TaxID=2268124 RepID=A0A367ZT54_9BACT|nr:MAG: GTP-binding protein TypA/BipA [Candidatus Ozemobacter sibiricus]
MPAVAFQSRYEPARIRNVAIIAHVDHGKTTLVDAMIRQSGLFRENQQIAERFLDSNDLERERGITILAKNMSLEYKGTKINLIDTPGHVDFGGEVERVLQMANGCLLVVDAFEGPMPQTRFVLKKALAAGLKPIVVINKIDRPDARPTAVVDEVLDLLIDVGAGDEALDFPMLFASGREGFACLRLEDPRDSILPLLEAIIAHVPPPPGALEGPARLLVTSLDYNDYVGRIAIGRVFQGVFKAKDPVFLLRDGSPPRPSRISQVFTFQGIRRVETESVGAGDVVALAGLTDVAIGDTVSSEESGALPMIPIDQPVISMLVAPNQSPMAGREGRFLTARQIQARLAKELETNVAMRVEPTATPETVKVSGRGELHLGILLETMRREGFELQVSKPQAILLTAEDGTLLEPIEELTIDLPEAYVGAVMEVLGPRRALLEASKKLPDGGIRLLFSAPARGLLGFRSALLTITNGTGVMNQCFKGYEPYRGEIAGRRNGVMVAMEAGTSTQYAIENLVERGVLFYGPGEPIYVGLVVGERPVAGDMYVNIVRQKHLTNVRSSTREELERIAPPRRMTLDQALEYVAEDEWLEITPSAVRLRKREVAYKRRG